MELDAVIARTAADAGWAAVEVYRCRLGHSLRGDAPSLRTGPRIRPVPRCPACGVVITRPRGSSRKMCLGACTRFITRMRSAAYERGEQFILEDQPWYKGHVTAYRTPTTVVPLDPFAGHCSTDWLAGWARWYGWA